MGAGDGYVGGILGFSNCNEKSYYICVIIDLYARKVIGYKVGKKNSTQLIKSTLKQAYESRLPDSSLIFHSDRGSNYCSKTLNDYVKSLGLMRFFQDRMFHMTILLSNLFLLP